MQQLILSMFVTVDGYVAGPKGEIDWFSEQEEPELDAHMAEFLDGIGGLLFGRETYQLLGSYWPTAGTEGSETDRAIAKRLNTLPKYVVSSTSASLDWTPAERVGDDVAAEVARLKKRSDKDLVLFGGASTAGFLMEHDLIDEYQLVVYPVVLGSGQALFPTPIATRNLALVDATTFRRSGAVILRYRHRPT